MTDDQDYMGQMQSFVDGILARDDRNLESAREHVTRKFTPLEGAEAVAPPPKTESETLEAIVSLHRPVFAVINDKVDPESAANGAVAIDNTDTEEVAMLKAVKEAAAAINKVVRSVGRIDLPDDENFPWVGTGWIVDSEI